MRKTTSRKLLSLAVILALVFSMTGCVRYSTTMGVKKNGTCDIEIVYAVYNADTGDLSTDEEEELEEEEEEEENEYEELEEEGWEVEDYKEDNYVGVTLTKTDIKLDELEDVLQDTDLGFDDFSLEKKGSTWVLEWDINDNLGDTSDEGLSEDTIKEYDGYMTFELTLPNGAKVDNATDVSKDGKTLTWDFYEVEDGVIECEFSLVNVGLIIGIIAAVVVVIAAVAVVLILKSKKGGAAPADEAPVMPEA